MIYIINFINHHFWGIFGVPHIQTKPNLSSHLDSRKSGSLVSGKPPSTPSTVAACDGKRWLDGFLITTCRTKDPWNCWSCRTINHWGLVGGWATPLNNMAVSCDDSSQYMEKYKMFQTTNWYIIGVYIIYMIIWDNWLKKSLGFLAGCKFGCLWQKMTRNPKV